MVILGPYGMAFYNAVIFGMAFDSSFILLRSYSDTLQADLFGVMGHFT